MVRTTVITPLLMLLASLPAAADAQAAQLLSDAGNQASLLKSDLDTIEFFGSSAGGWQSHSTIVTVYKQHIGALRSLAARLDTTRGDASSAQKTGIDRVVPLMQEFAATAEAMINTIDKNPGALNGSDYKQYVKLNSDLAEEFVTLIGASVNCAKTGDELARVAEKIGAAAPQLH